MNFLFKNDPNQRTISTQIYLITIFLLSVTASFWPMVQLFSYTRRYFEGATVFDFGFMGLGIVFIILLMLFSERKPKLIPIIFFIGLIGATAVNYFSIIAFPIMNIPSPQKEILLLGFIPSEQGMIYFLGLFIFGTLTMASLIPLLLSHTHNYPKIYRKCIHFRKILIVLLSSLGILLLTTIFAPLELINSFSLGAIAGSCAITLICLTDLRLIYQHYSKEQLVVQSMDGGKKYLTNFSLLISWGGQCIVLVLGGFVFFQLHTSVVHYEILTDFFLSIIIGLFITFCLFFHPKVVQVGRNFLFPAAITTFFLWLYPAYTKFQLSGPSILMGITVSFLILYFYGELIEYKKTHLIGVGLVLTFFGMGFVTIIPAYNWEIIETVYTGKILIWIYLVLEIIFFLVRIRLNHKSILFYLKGEIPDAN